MMEVLEYAAVIYVVALAAFALISLVSFEPHHR
jgi:hypothetical protein